MLLAWFCANGAVWNLVQVVAWGKMFADYSSVMSVTRALQLTFDGSKPCDLCHLAQAGEDAAREQQRQTAPLGGTDKLVLAFLTAAPVVVTAPDFAWPGLVHEAGLTRTDSVPVPPPRA